MFDENHLKSDLDEGGRVMDSYGYVMIKKNSHPYAQSSGYIKEHRLVITKMVSLRKKYQRSMGLIER